MDKKKVALVMVSLFCVSSNVLAAAQNNGNQYQGSVRSALTKTTNPYSPYYGKTSDTSNSSLKAMLAAKRNAREQASGKHAIEESVAEKAKVVEKTKPFAGAEPLPIVQRRVLADEGRYSEPENPTGYYLDGDKIAYPNQTRIIKHKQGKPVKIFMQAKRITDIFLKSDEHVKSVAVNDSFGLNIKKTYEAGRYSRWHISVVPIDNNPGTEMYIRTDKRSYHIYLEPTSDGEGYVPYVRFAYLEDRSVKSDNVTEQQQIKTEKSIKKKVVKAERTTDNAVRRTEPKVQKNVSKPVTNVGYGSKTAGGTSEGIKLYWSKSN